QIFELHKLTFKQEIEAKLVNAIRQNSEIFVPKLSIVATNNTTTIGHILLSKIKIKDPHQKEHTSLALAPISVHPAFQKKGIGADLIKNALEAAKDIGFDSVIVLGHENYYPKFGFVPTEKWQIKAPFEVPSKAFMAIELKKNALKNISGTVIYSKEFDEK
ncbi:MAG: GNAT family N-acetyltransferase, partial [Bacteroidales bacterium]